MPHRDPPPSEDEIRQQIWATTPCRCVPRIVIRHHRRRHSRVTAAHQPGCPIRLGHQRITGD